MAPAFALLMNPSAALSKEGVSENPSSTAPCSQDEGEEGGLETPSGGSAGVLLLRIRFWPKELPKGRLASPARDGHVATGRDVPIVAPPGSTGIAVFLPRPGHHDAAPMPRVGV